MRHRWLEPSFLGALFAGATALWAFIGISEEVGEGETGKIDTALLLALHPGGTTSDLTQPRWLWELARDITGLGSAWVLGLIVTATCAYFLMTGRQRAAFFVLTATSVSWGTNLLLKQHFNRPRPTLIAHDLYVTSSSFPSGHAMISATVYLTLGALLSEMTAGRGQKLYILCVATLLSTLVGVSRVYLGVHWPSDVLAGWAAGSAWALGAWSIAQMVHLERAPRA